MRDVRSRYILCSLRRRKGWRMPREKHQAGVCSCLPGIGSRPNSTSFAAISVCKKTKLLMMVWKEKKGEGWNLIPGLEEGEHLFFLCFSHRHEVHLFFFLLCPLLLFLLKDSSMVPL